MSANLAFGAQAPLLIQQTAMIVALVPVLRLLPEEGRRVLGGWPYLAMAFYLLLRGAILLLDSTLLYLWYQLLLAAMAIAATLWLLWRARAAQGSGRAPHRHAPLLRTIAWSAVALLAVAIAANVAGNTSLAEMLVAGVIDSGYMALLLYAAWNVFTTLLRVVFAHPSAAGLHLVRVQRTRLLDGLQALLAWAAIAGWTVFTLQRFRLFRPLYGLAHDVVTHRFTYGEFSVSLGDLLAFLLAIVLAIWGARVVRVLLQQDVLSRMSLPRGVGNSIASLAYYALLGVGLLAALSVAGFRIGQLTLLLGALGVGIGLGLQDVVKNFVSGLILMFERPLQPGDTIEIEGTSGEVRDIGMRATIVRTFEGADVVVPNGILLSEKLTNWTLRDRLRRIEVTVGVAYGSDPKAVARLLEETARALPGIATGIAPQVLFQGFGDNALDFSVRAWTHDYDNWVSLRSQLVGRIHDALGEAGIGIPFPQRDLHLRSVSDEAREALRPAPPPGREAP